ncbi:hypothetical protein GCM10022252_35550 [Streptosporangium oxazolinicum]|uniref:Large ribosomal subunit protein bL12 C-terminal domain-containing protein n=1 Tax=Streptosporangium oxazolinicum TaxID=909287 RepID=A0ABP8AXR0_9ACTN
MPNAGPMELLILAALLVVILVILVIVADVVMAVRRGTRAPVMPPTPQGVYETVTGLTRQGRKIEAIKELRQYTGLGLRESKTVVDAVALGHDLWSHHLMARFRPSHPTVSPGAGVSGPDLATRVRELKVAGRAEQAIHLVRGETGMGEREAALFVETLSTI